MFPPPSLTHDSFDQFWVISPSYKVSRHRSLAIFDLPSTIVALFPQKILIVHDFHYFINKILFWTSSIVMKSWTFPKYSVCPLDLFFTKFVRQFLRLYWLKCWVTDFFGGSSKQLYILLVVFITEDLYFILLLLLGSCSSSVISFDVPKKY